MRGSLGMKAGATGSEPAAMIALAKRTMRRPFGRLDRERVRRSEARPRRVTTVTLRCSARRGEARRSGA